MSIRELITLLEFKDGVGIIGSILVVGALLVEVSPIKINPIGSILSYIGKYINKEVNDKIDGLSETLNTHVSTYTERWLNDIRWQILYFSNECARGINHTREHFDFIMKKCDAYEKYIKAKDLPNGVTTEAMSIIRKDFSERMHNNSFLV